MDEAVQLLEACRDLRETLIIRYFLFNGLNPMELASARIEHLDVINGVLWLPRRHWKNNCVCDIDRETIQLQTMYSDGRRKGPLLRSQRRGHLSPPHLRYLVHRIADRTEIRGKEHICPRVLKYVFATTWLDTGGNLGSLQKQLSHKHLWSTGRYLRFTMRDVKNDHARLIWRAKHAQKTEPLRPVP